MILFKLQYPLYTTDKDIPVLIYNEGKSIQGQVPYDFLPQFVKDALNKGVNPKIFVHGEFENGTINLIQLGGPNDSF